MFSDRCWTGIIIMPARVSREITHSTHFSPSLSLMHVVYVYIMRTHMTRWKWFFHVITAVIRCHVVKCDKSFLYTRLTLGDVHARVSGLFQSFSPAQPRNFSSRAVRFTRDCVRRLAGCLSYAAAWHTQKNDLTDFYAGYKSCSAFIYHQQKLWIVYMYLASIEGRY